MLDWIAPLLSSLLVTAIGMPFLIRYFRSHHEGQMIREEGPSWHEKKSGTPTMGGLMFIAADVIACLWYPPLVGLETPSLLILLFILVLYGIVGMWDDSIKLFHRQNEGLKPWQKATAQVIGAVLFYFVYVHEGMPSALRIPGVGDWHLGVWYALFIIFWLVGFSNAVNLTDGLDGLVTGLTIIAFGAYAILAYAQHQYDVMIFCAAVVGGMIGFFPYNHKPAKIFMGDMGSLALGGALAAVSILLHHELSLLWIGIVFVIETASVILQVASFKLTGKRLFLMSPIHHHFEMKGWSEWRIDYTFWGVGLFTAITGLWAMLK
ncbi:phospho-N-acetylmuramoyl-pentapeptide-transferase [Levilactobacillus bambusae]|uniref:Phospho-N-acetylmuramoyl-pentapeptide-transferase n=1 Tax=Levilactobacillus bambusae TaxID=2024736 RepID=A0A2V1N3C2_9LACO|nr:phospho-N-acetylmuramoyl-pentapeptide-transferase [Levilactobacillus bambusae]PWG00635.1 phospho-N-acetylmuramoyl-pentapeptide-transferase [Levilactobacillus bambusae]